MWLSLVRVSTLSFLQCIDTVGLVTAETSGWPIKILRSSFTEQMAEGHWWQTSNQGSVGKRPLKVLQQEHFNKAEFGNSFLKFDFQWLVLFMNCWHCPHAEHGLWNGTASIHLSVPAWAHSSKPIAAGLLLWAWQTGDIDYCRCGQMQAVPHCQHT